MPSRKICNIKGCRSPLFARGYCGYHYTSEYLAPRMKRKSRQPIKRRSAKRASQESKYQKERREFIQEKRDEDPKSRIFCIFCGEVIYYIPDLHHAKGRDDEMILDQHYWFLAHNDCHTQEYHSKSWEDIDWWHYYLDRIKETYPDLYEKELLRMSKS